MLDGVLVKYSNGGDFSGIGSDGRDLLEEKERGGIKIKRVRKAEKRKRDRG